MNEDKVNPWDRELTMEDFPKPGRRIEMHPCTDWFMQGDRFGSVTKIDRELGLLRIKLDRSKRTIWVKPKHIDPGSFNPNRFLI